MKRCRILGAVAGAAAALLAAAHALAGAAAPGEPAAPRGALAADSLLVPTETFVLTREDLVCFNVHTLEDLLLLVPGVSWWREGPPTAAGGFSIEGRGGRGVTLLVNGAPVLDTYRLEAFTRMLPLSRLERVEIVYSGSPGWSGDASTRGFINLVIEEGGREAPTARLNFTYGGSERRARRAWFATPRAHASGVIAYDEYLQDAVECIPALPGRLTGAYDGRAVLGEILFEPPGGDRVAVRLRRFEDTDVGTAASSVEDVRWSGLSTAISYGRGPLSVSLDRQTLLLSRRRVKERTYSLAGRARLAGSLGPLAIRAFAVAERVEFEHAVRGVPFDPSYARFEGGAILGGALPTGVTWRAGAWGGTHDDVGAYAGGELALAKAWSASLSQDIVLARRLRLPSAEELYQPVITTISGGDTLSTSGDAGLGPELFDEITLGLRVPHLSIALFGRDESSLIALSGSPASVYRSAGSGAVTGARARFDASRRLLGVDCRVAAGAEGYRDRETLAAGVPEYRATGEIVLSRRVFRNTELLSVAFISEVAGRRAWPETVLPSYHAHRLSATMTIMGAHVTFEIRNLFDARYETVPGYTMPGRWYAIGLVWDLID